MDTARFLDDLIEIPGRLEALAGTLDRVIDPLGTSGRILVLGMGSSLYAAQAVAQEARAVGLAVVAEVASATLLPPPSTDLLVVAVSATGESAEVLAAIEPYQDAFVAVTNRTDSTLAQRANRVVALEAGTERSGVACRTFRHTLLVLRALLGLPGGADAARAAAASIAYLLDRREHWLPEVSDLLAGPDGTFLLAPSERLTSAQQGSLMLREVPRRPAFGSETGDWAHVDVYLTKTLDYRALLFAGSAWDEQAIDWMRQRGSTLVTVGGGHPYASASLRYPGDTDRVTAMLTEPLVPELLAQRWLANED